MFSITRLWSDQSDESDRSDLSDRVRGGAGVFGFLLALCLTACSTGKGRVTAARAHPVFDTRATYCAAPRKADGRVDVDRLVSELGDVGANTYSFCVHSAAEEGVV